MKEIRIIKEIKSHAPLFYKKRASLLVIFFLGAVGMLTFWTVKATGDNRFFLLHEDEVIYYCSAKLFAATNSVQAEGCIAENVSPIGKMNWYGPGYNLSYGILFKLFNGNAAIFPWFHFVLAVASLGIILLFPLPLESKLLLAIALSLTQQFCAYIFTFFPETLIMFLATILVWLLTLYYTATDERRKRKYLIAFVACTLLFMLWRITFIFWLACLLGLSHDRRSLKWSAVIFIGGVTISLVYMKLFTAPPYAGEMHKIDYLYNFKIDEFIVHTMRAINRNLMEFLNPTGTGIRIMLGLTGTSVVAFLFTRNKLILAALLTSGCIIGVMIAYYAVDEFYFIKQTGMLVPLLLLGLVAGIPSKIPAYLIIITLGILFPQCLEKVNKAINEGRAAYAHYESNAAFRAALAEIPAHIHP
jgi:ABC-type maltose transport system permease subunit